MAGGDNPDVALMTVVGRTLPARLTIDDMTTVAAVWTHAQLVDGTAITGEPLQTKIAAGGGRSA